MLQGDNFYMSVCKYEYCLLTLLYNASYGFTADKLLFFLFAVTIKSHFLFYSVNDMLSWHK